MKKLMLGNQAVARGAYEAGVKVISAYPGTPSTEVPEEAAKYEEIYAEWAPNEKVAAEVAIGASIAGVRSMCTMKHVGLNVAADPVFTAAYTGVNAGFAIVVADDPGMHSSQNEQDSRNHAVSAKIPMLEPSDSAECLQFTKKAFEISEKCDIPVFIRLTTRVAHSRSLVEVTDERPDIENEYVKNSMKYVMMPGMAKLRRVDLDRRFELLNDVSENSGINTTEYNQTEIGIITSGISYTYAKEAVPNASFLKLGMVNPLPENMIKDFASKVKRLIVIEELGPHLENRIKAMGVKVEGSNLFSAIGEQSVTAIKEKLLGQSMKTEPLPENPPARPPVLCPGCPHRATFYVLKKLKLRVCGDIGCYTLGAVKPLDTIDTCVCMGAGVSMSHGMELAKGRDFAAGTVAVIGDSTFIHSGITSLIDIVYNKGTSTVIILDNSITGMTGHQQNPATGLTLKEQPTYAIQFEQLARAVGVKRVVTADPFDLKEFEKIVKAEVAAAEPSVIIAKRPCALLKSVKYGATYKISADKCKNCKSCMKIGCPAIENTADGMRINDSLCAGCGVCVQMCAFGAIER